MKIERGPTNCNWEKLDRPDNEFTADSTVGTIVSSGKTFIFKWAKRRLFEPENGLKACRYIHNAYNLYEKVLPPRTLVPTTFVLGEKMNGRGLEFKPYVFQEFINSWTAKNAPASVLEDKEVVKQWSKLWHHLSILYVTARDINYKLLPKERFPIGITVGNARLWAIKRAYGADQPSNPATSPILLTKESLPQILLPDFGPYHLCGKEKVTRSDDFTEEAIAKIK